METVYFMRYRNSINGRIFIIYYGTRKSRNDSVRQFRKRGHMILWTGTAKYPAGKDITDPGATFDITVHETPAYSN